MNGQVFESVLIPQLVEDDRKKAKAAIRVIFLLQNKSPARQGYLFLILCGVMPSVERDNAGQNAGGGI